METSEALLREAFVRDFPALAEIWRNLLRLHSILLELRGKNLTDDSELRRAIDLLGAKGFADARAAQVLIEHGYCLGAFGSLRASQESGDLMRLLLEKPEHVKGWFREEKRFENLGWIRGELQPYVAADAYRVMSWGLHPNWRLIPQMMSDDPGPGGTHHELVSGPVANALNIEAFSIYAAFSALITLAAIHEHERTVVSRLWIEQFNACRDRLTERLEHAQLVQDERVALRRALAEAAIYEGQAVANEAEEAGARVVQ